MSGSTDSRAKLLSLALVGLMVLSMFAGPASAALATERATASSADVSLPDESNPEDIRGAVVDGPIEPAAVDDSQKLNTTDTVAVWERAPLSLRPNAAGIDTFGAEAFDFIGYRVNNTVVRVGTDDVGPVDLEKKNLYVYNQSTSIDTQFETIETPGAIENERTQLIAVRLRKGAALPSSIEDVGNLITSSEDTDARIVRNLTGQRGVNEFSFTPEQSGQYVFAAVLVEDNSEPGLVPAEPGNLTAESDITVVGIDQFLVQNDSSTISTPEVEAAGNTIPVNVDASNLQTDDVSHTVIVLDEQNLAEQEQEILLSGGDVSSINTTIANQEGATDIESDTNFVGSSLPSSEFTGNTDIVSFLDGLVSNSTDVNAVDNSTLYASVNGTVGSPSETVRVRTTQNFSSGEYTVLHFATAQNGTTTVSNKDSLQIQDGIELNIAASQQELQAGDSVTLTVTDPNEDPVVDANVSFNGRTFRTNGTGAVTFEVQQSGTATVTKSPVNGTPFVTDSIDLFVQSPQFETSVNFSAQTIGTNEAVVVNATVQDVNNVGGNTTLNLTRNGTIEETRDISVGAQGSVTESFNLNFSQTGSFLIEVNGVGQTIQVVDPEFNVTNVDFSAQTVSIGQTLQVEATVEDRNNIGGNTTLTLTRNNTPVETVTVEVGAQGSATGSFNLNFTQTGTFAIAVNGVGERIQVVERLPDLTTTLDIDREQRFADGVTANVTVENIGSASVENATVELQIQKPGTDTNTTLTNTTGSLSASDDAANNSTIIRFDFTPFAERNLLGDLADGKARVSAEVDPGDAIAEPNEGNNRAINNTLVRYADPAVSLFTPSSTVTGRNTTVGVFVENNGTAAIADATVNLSFGDGNTTETNLGIINASETARTELNNTYTTGGEVTIEATASDAVPFQNNATQNVTVREFNLSVTSISVPSTIPSGTNFTAVVQFDSNFPATVTGVVELPNGVELNTLETLEKNVSATSGGGVIGYQLRSNTSSDIENAELNVSLTALSDTAEANESVNITVPRIRISDSNSTQLNSTTTSQNVTVDVRATQTTFEHNLSVSVQGGAGGRTLEGLEYLFNYPYGCVEQTTSQMVSALRTDQYYQGDIPDDYDRERANSTILAGMQKLGTNTSAPGAFVDLAQNDDGSYSMYGGAFFAEGDPYYTTVALQGIRAVANDPIQSNRTEVRRSIDSIDSSATVEFLASIQESDGAYRDQDKYFLQDPYSSTGYTMVAIDSARPGLNSSADQTANETIIDAAVFLIENQEDDGSWNATALPSSGVDSNAQPTALALRGLAVVNSSDSLRSEVNTELSNRSVNRTVGEAVDGGVSYLVSQQNNDGSWSAYRDVFWFSALGEQTRATGHAMLALSETKNLTVVGSTSNASLIDASNYLVGVYDSGGSFGNTRASGVAIDALTTVDQRQGTGETVTISVAGESKSATISSGDPIATVEFNRSELSNFRNASTGELKVESANNTRVTVGVDTVQVVPATETEEETN